MSTLLIVQLAQIHGDDRRCENCGEQKEIKYIGMAGRFGAWPTADDSSSGKMAMVSLAIQVSCVTARTCSGIMRRRWKDVSGGVR